MIPGFIVMVVLGCLWVLPGYGEQATSKKESLLNRTVGMAVDVGFDCSSALNLQGDATVESTTVGLTSQMNVYGCVEFDESGGEVIYRLDLSEATELNLTLSNMTADLDLFLLDACDPMACIGASTGVSSETITQCLPAGTYYVVVDGFSGSSSAFMLAVQTGACTLCSPAVSNDTCPTAIPILSAGASFSAAGATCCAQDDYRADPCTGFSSLGRDVVYRLDMPPGCSVDVTLTDGVDAEPVDLSVYLLSSCSDPQGSCVAGSDSQPLGSESFSYTSEVGGIFFLVVDSFGNESCGDYQLLVEFTNCSVVGIEAMLWRDVKALYR